MAACGFFGNPMTTSTSLTASRTLTTSTSLTAAMPEYSTNVSLRGLACKDLSVATAFEPGAISWVYNWAAAAPPLAQSEFVPMLHDNSTELSVWIQYVQSAVEQGSKHVLSFNEPDLLAQANLSPEAAAVTHRLYMSDLGEDVRVGSPAVSNANQTQPPMGLPWLQLFLEACQGTCPIDFLAIHWYDSADNIAYFKWYLDTVSAFADRHNISEIWLTEFAATGESNAVLAFLGDAVTALATIPKLSRYAWYPGSDVAWVSSNGTLSGLGQVYQEI